MAHDRESRRGRGPEAVYFNSDRWRRAGAFDGDKAGSRRISIQRSTGKNHDMSWQEWLRRELPKRRPGRQNEYMAPVISAGVCQQFTSHQQQQQASSGTSCKRAQEHNVQHQTDRISGNSRVNRIEIIEFLQTRWPMWSSGGKTCPNGWPADRPRGRVSVPSPMWHWGLLLMVDLSICRYSRNQAD